MRARISRSFLLVCVVFWGASAGIGAELRGVEESVSITEYEKSATQSGYVGAALSFQRPDSGRRTDGSGWGVESFYERNWPTNWLIRGRVFYEILESGAGVGSDFYRRGLGADFGYRLSTAVFVQPRLFVGGGLVNNDVVPDDADDWGAYVSAGFGVLTRPLWKTRLRLRLGVRVNHDRFEGGQTDWQTSVGVVLPLGAQRTLVREIERLRYVDPPPAAETPVP